MRAEQTEPQRYDYEIGMHSLFRIAIITLVFDSCSSGRFGDSFIAKYIIQQLYLHDMFLTIGTVNKSCCSVLESPLNSN